MNAILNIVIVIYRPFWTQSTIKGENQEMEGSVHVCQPLDSGLKGMFFQVKTSRCACCEVHVCMLA